MPKAPSAIRRNPNATRKRACLGKTGRYDTEDQAKEAADRYARDFPWAAQRVPYPCPYSRRKGQQRHFHIGRELGRGR